LYQKPAFGAFGDFSDFSESTTCETSKSCQGVVRIHAEIGPDRLSADQEIHELLMPRLLNAGKTLAPRQPLPRRPRQDAEGIHERQQAHLMFELMKDAALSR
jgi:hypothetical protein